MSTPPRVSRASAIERVRRALDRFRGDHPRARIDVRRKNSYSIRMRVIDPSFAGMAEFERHDRVWPFLADLPEALLAQLSLLLLLTPDEASSSVVNRVEFESSTPPKS